ncbi:MAG: helix-turn-helix domain-containing protein [Candidatus Binataceae bacterium]
MQEMTAAWSSFTHYWVRFLGMNYDQRLETVLGELAKKFGIRDARGILLVPEFGHSDFAEMVGCSRPMVSRLIGEMISAGSLAQDGKHYIITDDSPSVLHRP